MGEKKLESYMTLEQASEYLNIPMRTLHMRLKEKVLRGYKPGRRLLFKREDLDLYMKRFAI